MKRKNITKGLIIVGLAAIVATGCKESESYSNLLNVENKAANWWLAQQNVENEIPADSILLYGEEAPFYKMDNDGYIYMQVVNPGNPDNRAQKGDLVYFRFTRLNIKNLYLGLAVRPEGNADDLSNNLGSTSFLYGNDYLSSTTRYGIGIQKPLEFLGYDCEVNLLLRSYYGFTSDQGQCIPYVYNVKYMKAEY